MAPPCGRQTLFLESFQPYNLAPGGPQYPRSLALHKVVWFARADKATRNFGRDQRARAVREAGGAHRTGLERGVDVGVRQHVVDVRLVAIRARRKQFGEPLWRKAARLFERVGFCVRVPGKFA